MAPNAADAGVGNTSRTQQLQAAFGTLPPYFYVQLTTSSQPTKAADCAVYLSTSSAPTGGGGGGNDPGLLHADPAPDGVTEIVDHRPETVLVSGGLRRERAQDCVEQRLLRQRAGMFPCPAPRTLPRASLSSRPRA